MIDIPVDIVSINCVNPEESIKALDYSCNKIKFNNSYLLTDKKIQHGNHKLIYVDKIKSISEYNNFCLKLNKFEFESDHILLIQDDGYVINAENWNNEFLKYDYIGAPWPNDQVWLEKFIEPSLQNFVSDIFNENRVGNGGFSLRSRKFLEYSENFTSCEGIGEDLFLTIINYNKALDNSIIFPDVEEALKFSTEFGLFGKDKKKWLKYKYMKKITSFGFHGKMNINEIKLKS